MKKHLLFILAALLPLVTNAHDFEADGIYYNITSNTDKQAEVTFKGNYYNSYDDEYSGSITIPATVTYDGVAYSVTSIGEDAFFDCSLTDINIPESVTSIGNHAFHGCSNLTAITIPEGVTSIGSSAFYECSSLTTINIPEGVTSIERYAFQGCSSLTAINIPEDVTSIEIGAFFECRSLTAINIPESSKLTIIGDHAFFNCRSLTAITLPEGVTSIGGYAFYDCSSLTAITCHAVTPPTVGNSYTFYRVDKSIPVYVPEGSVEDYKAAEYWSEFTNIVSMSVPTTLPIVLTEEDGLLATTSTNSAGTLQYEFTSDLFTLDEATNTLYFTFLRGKSNFNVTPLDHSGYPYVALAEFFLYDGEGNEIALSASNFSTNAQEPIEGPITNICDDDRTSYWHSTWSSGVGDYHYLKITLPAGQELTEFKFGYITRFTSHCLPSVIHVGTTNDNISFSLSGTHGENINWSLIDGNLIVEGTGTLDGNFTGLGGIKSVEIKEGITAIGKKAFEYCSSLTSITIPEGVTSIGYAAFYDCSSLTAITIPESVTSIGNSAFSGCSSLTAITIPESVTSIWQFAFEGCSSLTAITCHAVTPPTVDNPYTFFGVDKSIPVYVPEGSIEDYKAAGGWSEFTNITALTPTEVSITINQYGSGTYCSEYALDFSNVEGLKAYAATGYDTETGVVTLLRVMTAKAGVGLFIKGEPGEYRVPVIENTSYNSLNMLVGTLTETAVNATSGDGLYANYKYTIKEGNSQPLFYQFNDGSTLGAGKAYLQIPMAWLPQTSEAKSISLRFEEGEGTTDMENSQLTIENSQFTIHNSQLTIHNSQLIFDLYGRRVDNPVKGGIYIVGGRKVVVK